MVRGAGSVTTALALALLAPQSQQPPTIRSRTTLVPVDVRVIDRDGKPVTDLKKEDFTVLENGVRQDVRFFDTHTLTPEAPRPGPLDLRKVITPDSITPDSPFRAQNQRIFLFVFGRGRLQAPAKGIDDTIRFIKDRLLPQDRVAVMAYNRATDFTTDRAAIVATIERFRNAHEKIEAEMKQQFSGLQAVYGGKTPYPSIQKEIDDIFHAPGAVNARRLPPGTPTDAGQIADDRRRTTDDLQRADILALRDPTPWDTMDTLNSSFTDMSFDEYARASAQTSQDLGNIYTGINYLKYLEGEKHLVFVTEGGLFLPRLENDYSIAALASDARVVLDTLQTGGLITMDPMPRDSRTGIPRVDASRLGRVSIDQGNAIQTLRTLAAMTGGTASVYAPTDKALARIDLTSRFDYLLGYEPTNNVLDGRFRRITVSVNRKDVRVLYRHGYYARDNTMPLDRRAFLTYNRIVAAANITDPLRDLNVSATAEHAPGSPDLLVHVTLHDDRIKFEHTDGRHKASLEVAYFAGTAKQAVIGQDWQVVDLDLTDQNYEIFRTRGVSYTQTVPVTGDPVYVKVIAYDYAADALGSALVRLSK
jgi:VWFA-related protein